MLNSTNKQAYPLGLITNVVANTDNLIKFQRDPDGRPLSGGIVSKATFAKNLNLPKLFYVPVINDLVGANHAELYQTDGIGYIEQTRTLMANILLNHMCNQRLADAADAGVLNEPFKGTCCVDYAPVSESSRAGLSILLILSFISILFFFFITVNSASESMGVSVLQLVLPAFTLLMTLVVVFYVYYTERTHKFVKVGLNYTPYLFIILIQFVGFLGAASFGPTKLTTGNLKNLKEDAC